MMNKRKIYRLPEGFTKLSQWKEFNKSYCFDENAVLQRTTLHLTEVEPPIKDFAAGKRKRIYIKALINHIKVKEAIEKARKVGDGSAEDIYGGLVRNYISLKKTVK